MKKTLGVFLFLTSAHALAKSAKSPFIESVSVTIEASGDLKGRYEFSGPMGAELKAVSDGSICEMLALF
jgi:hypothetical protein